MKNILLLVHDDAGQEARFQAALDVVRAVEGHLICLDVTEIPDIAGDSFGVNAVLLEDERQRESANRVTLERRLEIEGLPWNWVDATGHFATCIQEASELADLIVVNRHLDSLPVPDMRSIAADALVNVAKPLLAVPEASRGIKVTGHAMIAWDGSPQASTALSAAVPLLRLAERVTIAQVDDGSIKVSGEEAASYLSRHDISATLRPRQPATQGAATDLLKLVQLIQPDYLVMGAFGQSRVREALFGGVSRRMLSESPIPLFLAH